MNHFLSILRRTRLRSYGDHNAPSIPQNLAGTVISTSRIDLTWDASTDAVGVVQYNIYQDDVLVTTSATNAKSITGLTEYTQYVFKVSAQDAAGNESALSSSTTKRTLDATAPSVPTGLAETRVNPTRVDLTWNASTDSGSGVDYYIVWQDDVDIAHVTAPAVTKSVTGLTQDTSYTFKVSAVDLSTNASAKSTGVTTKAWTPYVDLDNQLFLLDAKTGHYTLGTGTNVASWDDQSANANHALQATAGLQPNIEANDPSPLDSVRFTAASHDRFLFTGKGAAMGAAITAKFSFSVWFKLDTTPSDGIILDNNYSAGHLQLAILTRDSGGNNIGIFLSANGSAVAYHGKVAHTGWTAWHHLVFIYDGSLADSSPDNPPTADDRLKAWIDGIAVTIANTSGSVPASLFSGDLDWQIASESGAVDLNGRLDNMYMTTDVLTAAEIANLFAFRSHA